MSQRTIIEFNHDYVYAIEDSPLEFAQFLKYALCSGDDKHWEILRQFGVTKIVQLHHSDERKVVTKNKEYPIG